MTAFEEKEYTKNFDKKLWKRMVELMKPFRKKMVFLGFFMISLAGVDVVFPLLNKYAVDNYIVPHQLDGIETFVFLYFGLIMLQALNIYFFIAIAGKIETHLSSFIRKKGFEQLQKLSYNYYDKTPVGWIMARMTSDSTRLGSFISWGLIDMIWGGSLMILIAIVMLILNWKLALLSLTVVPLLVFISIYFQRKILKSYRLVRKTNSKITGAYNEGISGAKTTKTLVREEENLKEFQVQTNTMFRSSVRAAIFSSLYLPIIITLGSIGTGIVIWLGGESVVAGALSYGTLVAFIAYTIQFFEPLMELARVFAELQDAQASAERIFSLLDEEPEIQDNPLILSKWGNVLKTGENGHDKIRGAIEFKDIDFTYKKGEKVLENFNLQVKAGETVALVGETGSGKSTIVNLACRFYEPQKGGVFIDGTDYRERSQLWLHSQLGYVLQSPHLFSGTIRDNIRYGRLDASDDEIEYASKLVNAHEFIMKKSKKYDSEVGEGGSLISTGEKQLISFARAILADPRIFILDEATSSVDTETEKIIQKAIETVLKDRTSFIIAHRLSTIKAADRILVVKNGKIIEEGNHYQLLKAKGYYYRLYTNQFMEEKENILLNA